MKKLTALALSLSSIVLIGAAVAAVPASASTTGAFCPTAPENHICPSKYPDGTVVKAQNTGPILFKLGFAEEQCNESSMVGTVQSEGFNLAKIKLSSFTMQNCSAASEVLAPNIWYLPWAEGTNNAAGGYGFTEWRMSLSGTTCVYDLPAGMKLIGGSPAVIEINGKIDKVAGGIFCANPAGMTARYKVTSPSPLYVEKE